eukprot:2279291-Pleurochrysis_carterae.AAC.1
MRSCSAHARALFNSVAGAGVADTTFPFDVQHLRARALPAADAKNNGEVPADAHRALTGSLACSLTHSRTH